MELKLQAIPTRRVVTLAAGGKRFQVKNGFPIHSIYPIIKDDYTINPFALVSAADDSPITIQTDYWLRITRDSLLPDYEDLQRVGCESNPEARDLCDLIPEIKTQIITDQMNLILEFDTPLMTDVKFVFEGYRIVINENNILNYKFL